MSQYDAFVPADGTVPPEVQRFFASFYKTSDNPSAHEEYADQFTRDGTLIMISDRVTGRNAIIQKRLSMWEKVASRSHKPTKIYTFGLNSSDFMLFGTVDFGLKDGREASSIEWAARAHLTNEGGRLRMDFYQVYLDSADISAKAH